MTTPAFMPDNWFRELTPEEEQEFRQWARDNYDPNTPASPLWHPVVREEWAKLATPATGPDVPDVLDPLCERADDVACMFDSTGWCVVHRARLATPATPMTSERLTAEQAIIEVLSGFVPHRLAHGHAIGGEWAADLRVGLMRLGFDVQPLATLDAVPLDVELARAVLDHKSGHELEAIAHRILASPEPREQAKTVEPLQWSGANGGHALATPATGPDERAALARNYLRNGS